MAKKSHTVMQLQNEEVNTHTKYMVKIPARGLKQGMKLRKRKFDPVTRKHHWFVVKKLPSHAK